MRVAGVVIILASAGLVACEREATVAPPDGGSVVAGCGDPVTWASGGGIAVDDPAGRRAVGAACAFAGQCASGLCGADRAAGACGVCVARRMLGERCDGALQGCAESAACDNGTCVSRKKVAGATCALYRTVADQGECDDELFCDPGSPPRGNPTGVCTPRLPLGAPCGIFQTCARGALCRDGACVADDRPRDCRDRPCPVESYCTSTDAGWSCQAGALPLGAPCAVFDGAAVPGECAPGSLCNIETIVGPGTVSMTGTCVPSPRAGEACAFSRCAAGFTCVLRAVTCSSEPTIQRCEPLRALGESCETSWGPVLRDPVTQFSTCAPGLECRNSRCEPPCASP